MSKALPKVERASTETTSLASLAASFNGWNECLDVVDAGELKEKADSGI